MPDQFSQLSEGQQKEQSLRGAGFTDDEVNQWKGETSDQLTKGGYSPQEIRDYWGIKNPNLDQMKDVVKNNMAQANQPSGDQDTKPKREPIDTSIKPVEAKDMLDVLAAGFGNSNWGMILNGGESPIALSPNKSTGGAIADKTVAGVGQFIGDSPEFFLGGLAGGSTGAFAAPEAMRQLLINYYRRDEMTSAGEFARHAVSSAWQVAKAGIVGKFVGMAGEGVGLANNAVTSPLARALTGTPTRLGAEAAAMTTVSSALEGHLPNLSDFGAAAVTMGGLHAIGYGTGKIGYVGEKLQNIYAKTGATPDQVVEATTNDDHVRGEVLSANPNLPKEAAPLEKPEDPPATGWKEPEQPKGDSNEPHGPTPDEAKSEILSRIGKEKDPEKLSYPDLATRDFVDLYHKGFDYADILKQFLKKHGEEDLDEKNSYVLQRLHSSVQQKLMGFMNEGTRDWNTGEVNGEPFRDIVNDFLDKTGKSFDDLRAFAIANRNVSDLRTRDIQQRGNIENDQEFLNNNMDIEPYAKRLTDWTNRSFKYLVDSGRYSQEFYNRVTGLNKNYFPFEKILDSDELTGEVPTATKALKKIGTDTENLMKDPVKGMLLHVDRMIRLAHETEAQNEFVNQFRDHDSRDTVMRVADDQNGPLEDHQIAEYQDGKRIKYDTVPEIADSLKRMAGAKLNTQMFSWALSPFAKAIRIGSIDNPVFAAYHTFRNQLSAFGFSKTNIIPFIEPMLNLPSYVMGKMGLDGPQSDYNNFVFNGGSIESIKALKSDYIDTEFAKLENKNSTVDKLWNSVQSVADVSHMIMTNNDNLIRYTEYRNQIKRGTSPKMAAFYAKEALPDFSKQGLEQNAMLQNTAFLPLHVQGMSRMAQALGEDWQNMMKVFNGENTSQAAKDLATGFVAKNIAMFTVPSILLALAQQKDDAVDDVPNFQKYTNWIYHPSEWRRANSVAEAMSVKDAYPSEVRFNPDINDYEVNDGKMWRFQKPFTTGAFFASLPEAILDSWKKNSPKPFEDFVKTVGGTALANPIVTAAVKPLEAMTNMDFYTHRPIIRQSMENKVPEMRYDSYTSETAKLLGHWLGQVPLIKDTNIAAPAMIDHFLHWGSLSGVALDALDKGLEKTGIVPDPIKPVSRLDEIPFVRQFMIRYPTAHPQSVEDFLERYQKADQVYNSIKALASQGKMQEAFDLEEKYKYNMDRLRGIDKNIQDLNSAIQKINQSPDIDPVQKRQLIDQSMFRIIGLAKFGNAHMDQFEKNAQNK